LQVRETANKDIGTFDYEFKVFDNPVALRNAVLEKNRINNKARLVAGYCWPWASKKDKQAYDIEFPEYGLAMKWNLVDDGNLWILKPGSVREVGCIHTCQGLELDYIGVIVGPDFVVRDGLVQTDAGERANQDRSVLGYKGMLKKDPEGARAKADVIIKNTYRTLMTRGQKGCYVFCTDPETREYFRSVLETQAREPLEEIRYPGLNLRVLEHDEVIPFENAVPILDVYAAAGRFSEEQFIDEAECEWVELPELMTPRKGLFVVRVQGESMNRRIPNGAWCLFQHNPAGSRQGKVVLVQHRQIGDVDMGGRTTVKVYRSEKASTQDGNWTHSRIILSPDTTSPGYEDIIISEDDANALIMIGQLVAVLP